MHLIRICTVALARFALARTVVAMWLERRVLA